MERTDPGNRIVGDWPTAFCRPFGRAPFCDTLLASKARISLTWSPPRKLLSVAHEQQRLPETPMGLPDERAGVTSEPPDRHRGSIDKGD